MRVLNVVKTVLPQALLAAARPSCGQLHNPVTLADYGTFSGTTVNTSFSGLPLPNHVDAWLGMDFGVTPERFSPAQWPEPFRGVKDGSKYGSICVQEITASYPEAEQSEDCLNFNVYRTPGVPLDQKLPVLVWIYGGAFFFGSYKSFDGASFAASSKDPMVVVTFNYRVSSLGFLPSKLFDEEGLSNLGIRDQRLMLEFVQKHIGSFGGDKDDLTLGGRSAGGHSVGIHYFHNYGSDAGSKPLFSRAIMQSGSVTSRAFPDVAYPLYQRQYAEYMAHIGCDNIDSNSETLDCLRSADLNDIRDISNKIFWENHPNVTWPFQPVQGGTLFEKTGTQSGIDRTFFHVPVISSTTSDEGKTYMPGNFETNDEFLGYMHNGSPALNDTDLELLESLHPDPATDNDPNSPFANSPNSTQYNRLSAAWSDYGYACPSQETSYRTSAAGVPTWKLRFNTNNRYPDWQGIPHASDTRYTWNDPAAQYPEISPIYHGYLSSFVTTGDPNTNRHPGSPEWLIYEPEGYELDKKPGRQLVVQPGDIRWRMMTFAVLRACTGEILKELPG